MRRPSPTPATVVLEVEPAASTLLDVLVDLGHLDEQLLNEVNDRLLDAQPEDGVVTLDAVRRIAAQVIFDKAGDADPEQQRVLEQEWGLIFY